MDPSNLIAQLDNPRHVVAIGFVELGEHVTNEFRGVGSASAAGLDGHGGLDGQDREWGLLLGRGDGSNDAVAAEGGGIGEAGIGVAECEASKKKMAAFAGAFNFKIGVVGPEDHVLISCTLSSAREVIVDDKVKLFLACQARAGND